ncbi:MAG: hypothetical protein HC822_27260 [Oscillochloris sp.]|nr:hypothetical protein [Oscillochloris sp.]
MSAPTNTRRLSPALIAGAAVVGIGLLAFIWWTVSPLFISSSVDEAFPTSAAVAPTAAPAIVAEPTAAR